MKLVKFKVQTEPIGDLFTNRHKIDAYLWDGGLRYISTPLWTQLGMSNIGVGGIKNWINCIE